MIHIKPKDSELLDFVGRKLKINRADEEFIGNLDGWESGKWKLRAANASFVFLPSDGWEVYVCEDVAT